MTKELKHNFTGAVLISLAAMLWGVDGILLTPRLHQLDVSFVVFIVHLIPFLLMSIVLHKEFGKVRKLDTITLLALGGTALFGGILGTYAIVKALFLVNFKALSVVVLIQKLQPVFAILLARLVLKERLSDRFILWAILAISAGYFLTFGDTLPNFDMGDNTLQASLYALFAAFCFGSSTVFSKVVLQKTSFTTATFGRYGFVVLIMLFVVIITGKFSQVEQTTTEHWIVFVLIGLTTGSGAILLFYKGLKTTKAIVATICELFFPITAILLDHLFNGTRFSAVQWMAAAVMMMSIIMLNIQQKRRKK